MIVAALLSCLLCNWQVETKDTVEIDVRPYIETAADDFMKRKDAAQSNVCSILIDCCKIHRDAVIGITVIPKDSLWEFLLSDIDTIGTSYVSISYIERENFLFYWYVDGNVLTQEIYDKLDEYDCIERRNVPDHSWLIGEGVCFNDGQKVHQYYFSCGNPARFRRTYHTVQRLPKRMFIRKTNEYRGKTIVLTGEFPPHVYKDRLPMARPKKQLKYKIKRMFKKV